MMTHYNTPCAFNTVVSWYAVYCKPHKELLVANALKAYLGLKVYLPEICTVQHGQITQTLCFPRYLFMQANLHETPINHIQTTPGVVTLVGFDGGPQVVPEVAIDAIHQQVEQINHHIRHPTEPFCPGDAVRLREGPLQGLEGLFVEAGSSHRRVKILVHMLGQLSRAEVDIDTLEHAKTQPNRHPPRRTRGRGRRIRACDDTR